MILKRLNVGNLEANCYILAKDKASKAIIIDPGADAEKIKAVLERFKLEPALIIHTHGHFDHIGADNDFDLPVYIHQDDLILLTDSQRNLSNFLQSGNFKVKNEIRVLKEKEKIEVDGVELEVVHLPGHTPGGIALLLKKPEENILFSGDSLFCHSIGRTDFPGASEDKLIDSIKKKIFCLSPDTLVYPGHGPTTSIAEEIKNNPYL